jgi:photosystem II stability/assembly factor-like uncharacterized protein
VRPPCCAVPLPTLRLLPANERDSANVLQIHDLSSDFPNTLPRIDSLLTPEYIVANLLLSEDLSSGGKKGNMIQSRSLYLILFILTTSSVFAQWTQTNGLTSDWISCFALSDEYLYAGTNAGGVARTSDGGASWTALGLKDTTINTLAICGSQLFAGGNGVYRSTNHGTAWTAANTGLEGLTIRDFSVVGEMLFAATEDGSVFLTTNGGILWSPAGANPGSSGLTALAVAETVLYAGATGPNGGVFRSTSNGASWTQVSISATGRFLVNDLAVEGDNIYVATTTQGVYLIADAGTGGNEAGLSSYYVASLAANATTLFAGTWSSGVFISTNQGASWLPAATGLTNNNISALTISGEYVFAGTAGSGVWKRQLANLVSVEVVPEERPGDCLLKQNFPNPFNAATNIGYGVGVDSRQPLVAARVRLAVYDLLGRMVAVLVDEMKQPGQYTTIWDATGMPSGVYFCRLSVGSRVEINSMVLMK